MNPRLAYVCATVITITVLGVSAYLIHDGKDITNIITLITVIIGPTITSLLAIRVGAKAHQEVKQLKTRNMVDRYRHRPTVQSREGNTTE